MIINVEKMIMHEHLPVSYTEIMSIPNEYGVIGNHLHVAVDGILCKKANYFTFDAKAYTQAELECALCLQPVSRSLNFEIHDKYSRSFDTIDDEDVWRFDYNEIDLDLSVSCALLLTIPAKVLCAEDCNGLCPVCGQNLNQNSCTCTNEDINPHFSKLKDLFKE